MYKTIALCCILLFPVCRVAAQYIDTVVKYYTDDWEQVDPDKSYYAYIRIAKKTVDSIWHVKDYYADTKTLQMEGTYLDDSLEIQDGLSYYYYRSGKLQIECSYNKDNNVGLYREYYENGQLADSTRYKSTGIAFGKSFGWNKDGKLIFYGEYDINGSGSGYETLYYDNGKLSASGKCTTGYIKDSTWTYYYDDGTPSLEDVYDSGKLIHTQCYDRKGRKLTECDTAFYLPEPDYGLDLFVKKLILQDNVSNARNWSNKYIDLVVYARMSVDRKGLFAGEVVGNPPPWVKSFVEYVFNAMPSWMPAMDKNRPIDYSGIARIPFSIPSIKY